MDLTSRLAARLANVERENIDRVKTLRKEISELQESIRERQEAILAFEHEVDDIRTILTTRTPSEVPRP